MKRILVLVNHDKYKQELKNLADACIQHNFTIGELWNLKRNLRRNFTYEVEVRTYYKENVLFNPCGLFYLGIALN